MKPVRDRSIADAVRRGLTSSPRVLSPFLFYDAKGSALFEEITRLPEYYPTRTERSILEKHAEAIARALLEDVAGPLTVVELGAGTAEKTELLLRALVAESGERPVTYVPADVSPRPLEAARARLAQSLPALRVAPLVGPHEAALDRVERSEGAVAVLFLGGSIGNYDDHDAGGLLGGVRKALGARGSLLLGVDHAKSLDVLLPAYDDSAGVTAAFNRNVLARINGDLDADFRVETFAHVALWNAAASAIEMHLESTVAQSVWIGALDLHVSFDRGERIHTESSHKYTAERVGRLFQAAGLAEGAAFEDERRWFSLRIARSAR